jgi:hypothetical protein
LHKPPTMSHEKFQSCIDACYECATLCDHCAAACLKESDVKMLANCIELDIYCADICRLTAHFMAKGEKYAGEACALCAKVCRDCADECARHKHGHCKACSEACSKCAEECSRMAA